MPHVHNGDTELSQYLRQFLQALSGQRRPPLPQYWSDFYCLKILLLDLDLNINGLIQHKYSFCFWLLLLSCLVWFFDIQPCYRLYSFFIAE